MEFLRNHVKFWQIYNDTQGKRPVRPGDLDNYRERRYQIIDEKTWRVEAEQESLV